MPYDTLIFDLDGTLTDPVVGIVRCTNFALTSLDFSPRSEKEIAPYIGPPLRIALRELSASDDPACIEKLVDAYRERYGEFGYAENTIYDGIYDMLDTLKTRGIRMGVCTSKYQKYAIKILQEFKLIDYFDFVKGSDSHVGKSEQLAELLASDEITSNAVMIGDRAVDLTAAKSNGLRGIAVLWGYGDREELAPEEPLFIAATPHELGTHLLENPVVPAR